MGDSSYNRCNYEVDRENVFFQTQRLSTRGSRRVAVLGGIVFGLFIAFSMCILILLLQRPSQQPVKVKDCYVRGFCLSGDVISRTFPDHFDGCIEDCLLHKDCKTISYSWNGKVCQLMKSCSDISRSNCPNCVTHNIVECPQRNICASNGQCHGKMHSLPIVRTNETECQRLCSNDVTCNWFSFDQTHVVCSLYATCDTLQEDPNQAIISKMGFCDGSHGLEHKGYIPVSGKGWESYIHKRLKNGVDYQNCAWICDSSFPKCQFFTISEEGTCYLGNLLAKSPVVLNEEIKSIELEQDTFFGLTVNRSSIKYDYQVLNSDEANCFSTCWLDNDCKTFFYMDTVCYLAGLHESQKKEAFSGMVYYKNYISITKEVSRRKASPRCPDSGYVNLTSTTIDIHLPYGNSMNCTWYIHNPNFLTHEATITFKAFETEKDHDYVKMYAGTEVSETEDYLLTGNLGKQILTWTEPFVTLLWITDVSENISDMVAKIELKAMPDE